MHSAKCKFIQGKIIEIDDTNISFYVDFFENNDFGNIEKREYKELSNEIISKITMIEILNTKEFIDFIDSNVIGKFGEILNYKIEMQLDINDTLIKVKYQGMLNIK
ncbi:MAG: hypothetical protein ACK5HP_03790 [Bacilli bacterium]